MNRRRELLLALSASLAASLRAGAQAAERVYRIGMLFVTSRGTTAGVGFLQAFEQGLRELGYVEGKNLILESRGAEGRLERLPTLAAELVALKVDLIVAGASQAAVAAAKATKSIPIVFVASPDPVGLGLVKSLARPGTNVTGFTNFSDAIVGKQLELMRELFPRISRLAVIHSPGDAASMQLLPAMRTVSAALNLQVRLYEVKAEADIDTAFSTIQHDRTEGLQVFLSTITFIHRVRITELAAQHMLPAVYGLAAFVEAGGLMSYSFSFSDNYRRAAVYVDRILKGAKPAELPVQEPTKLELAVNLRTARALGLALPRPVLLRADRMIE